MQGKTDIIVNKGKSTVRSRKLVAILGKSQPLVVNTALVSKKYCSMTPPFLLTFEMFNKKVHNCLVDHLGCLLM